MCDRSCSYCAGGRQYNGVKRAAIAREAIVEWYEQTACLGIHAILEMDEAWSDLDDPWYDDAGVYSWLDYHGCSCCAPCDASEDLFEDVDPFYVNPDLFAFEAATIVCGHDQSYVDMDEDGTWQCFHSDCLMDRIVAWQDEQRWAA